MKKNYLQLIFTGLFLISLPQPVNAGTLVIDDFSYSSNAAARAAWIPSSYSPPVIMAASGPWGDSQVMVLPIQLTAEASRNYWDRYVNLDLSETSNFSLELYVENPEPISIFTLYFHSPGGWAGNNIALSQPGWQTLTWDKKDYTNEDSSFDWSQVDRIRLSPWKQTEGESRLALQQLFAFSPEIYIVLGSSDYTDLMDSVLSKWGLSYGYISDASVAEGFLNGAELAIFPYNNTLSETELDRIEDFISSGGKVLVFYSLPNRLADLLGIQVTGWMQDEYPGQFSAYRFNAPDIPALPEKVLQNSWNITLAEPAVPDARVIAYWEDSGGNPLAYPAWIASNTGAYMSHVLLQDDPENKEKMLLALLGYYRPKSWQEAAKSALNTLERIGDHYSYSSAVEFIHEQSATNPRSATVEIYLAEGETLRQEAIDLYAQSQFRETVLSSLEAKKNLLEAYYYCQSPLDNEFRAFWEHSGLGAYPGNWEKSAQNLKDHGFTAIIPDMLWGGLAHYNSALLPHSEEFAQYGDQITQCVQAAHGHGLEVHVWKVNWNLSRAPQNWIDTMRAAERTQVDVYGNPVDWLCPSHPDNLALEHDTMLEVAENYPVNGIHFDYIRYPNNECCYCDGCRHRFETYRGEAVENWPWDCYNGALASEYRDWRAEQITRLVQQVSATVRQKKLNVKISAAVFSQYPSCRQSVGQDWVNWVQSGYLDFICPMDYTSDFGRFQLLVSTQIDQVGGKIPLYPGIGATASSNLMGSDGVIAQILTTRTLGTAGFVIFNYNQSLAEQMLPDLHKGITAMEESTVNLEIH